MTTKKLLKDRLLAERLVDPVTGCWIFTGVKRALRQRGRRAVERVPVVSRGAWAVGRTPEWGHGRPIPPRHSKDEKGASAATSCRSHARLTPYEAEQASICFHAFHQRRRASRGNLGAVFFAHIIHPAGVDDKVVALIAALLLQGHELVRLLLRLGNAEWRKGLDDSRLCACRLLLPILVPSLRNLPLA
jgi:hypothetical protein